MPAVVKQSWFWSMIATIGVMVGGISAYSRQTTQFETAISEVNSRVKELELATPKETRWIVDQHTNFFNEMKGDVASIRGSIRKIELILARSGQGSAGLAATPPTHSYE